jgi:hypothetical protein
MFAFTFEGLLLFVRDLFSEVTTTVIAIKCSRAFEMVGSKETTFSVHFTC